MRFARGVFLRSVADSGSPEELGGHLLGDRFSVFVRDYDVAGVWRLRFDAEGPAVALEQQLQTATVPRPTWTLVWRSTREVTIVAAGGEGVKADWMQSFPSPR